MPHVRKAVPREPREPRVPIDEDLRGSANEMVQVHRRLADMHADEAQAERRRAADAYGPSQPASARLVGRRRAVVDRKAAQLREISERRDGLVPR